jgi:hypothetical protein
MPVTINDKSKEVIEAIRALSRVRVYVGIPGENAGRTDGAITNPVIGYLMEHGMPDKNVPARPFLVPGVAAVQTQTIAGLQRAGKYAMAGKLDDVLKQLNAIGQRAANSVQATIRNKIPPPLAQSTVAARLRQTQGGKRRLKRMRKAGTDLFVWGKDNLTPLFNTGELLKSVTYVIRKVK